MLCGGLGGCFKSSTSQASSESSSKSSSSPFRSSSKSSSPEKSFGEDVAEATRSWTLTGGDVASLQHDISRLATDAGISDWESRRSTWEGVGRGLKRAGVGGARLEDLKTDLAGGDEERKQWIAVGYESE
jgi:hypothetical protein